MGREGFRFGGLGGSGEMFLVRLINLERFFRGDGILVGF